MSLFRRSKRGSGSGSKGKGGGSQKKSKKDAKAAKAKDEAASKADSANEPPESPGSLAGALVATGVAGTTDVTADAGRGLPPRREPETTPNIPTEVLIVDEIDTAEDITTHDREPVRPIRDVTPLFSNQPAAPELEVDPMATIGRQTTITGNIVAEEDLEIHGTIEGSVRLSNHQVTVGPEGQVKASVDAECVTVYGRITGDVVSNDVVEVHKGGIVGGDIRAPRIIMHDGAIVVGGLDMSAALPNASLDATRDADKEVESGPRLAAVSPILDDDKDGELPAIEVEAD